MSLPQWDEPTVLVLCAPSTHMNWHKHIGWKTFVRVGGCPADEKLSVWYTAEEPSCYFKPLKYRHFILMDILLRNGLHSQQQLFIITLEIQTHSISGQAFSPSIPRLYKVHLIMQMLGCLSREIVQHCWLESSGTCLVALNSMYCHAYRSLVDTDALPVN